MGLLTPFCPEGRLSVHNDCPRGRVFTPFKSCPGRMVLDETDTCLMLKDKGVEMFQTIFILVLIEK